MNIISVGKRKYYEGKGKASYSSRDGRRVICARPKRKFYRGRGGGLLISCLTLLTVQSLQNCSRSQALILPKFALAAPISMCSFASDSRDFGFFRVGGAHGAELVGIGDGNYFSDRESWLPLWYYYLRFHFIVTYLLTLTY